MNHRTTYSPDSLFIGLLSLMIFSFAVKANHSDAQQAKQNLVDLAKAIGTILLSISLSVNQSNNTLTKHSKGIEHFYIFPKANVP